MLYKLISNGTKPPKELHHSGTDTVKIFHTLEDANAMKDELNTITVDNVHWKVIPLSAEKKK
ncbi:hypothetical protein MUO14_17160 [Halobacillus shinanisalinarum]|uniref:Uncharacterized protein n=1 Tax=Halobacillus shinanisalinarum TaxID=2932258 RepID=A0ABY4GVK1_9BACI|nr:hypothetical protein [Halobacillus shinanisalinarum]UOQ92202.1 hypothetical protein MUO14_17160 [Halobacillus shinanisalinarum]